ncbi:MAG TPA: aldehyde dehydrogenase (NADP(+)) [Glaciihabitans sp.]|jgi:NADP-dependent aldehyde dehydrogenase|nr:aldehyde dehydrogenase (NADP(+)) [Glaciihabitans sp.]
MTVVVTDARQRGAIVDDAAAAVPVALSSTRSERAEWLRRIAVRLDEASAELVLIAERETHLGATRLEGEVARTTNQLRLFADVIEEASYLEATIDAAPGQQEIRRYLRPIGAVAVFSASNFPFAFSVAGGDTASALAAGCPVVVKAHSGHTELSRRTAQIVTDALAEAGAPAGMFGLTEGREAGLALTTAAAIRAVSFTGSLAGARALMDSIASREDPIPFYGELGSINPVVITPEAVRARADELANGLVTSFTLGGGQFCTKPGVVFVPAGMDFAAAVRRNVQSVSPSTLLTERISAAFGTTAERLLRAGDVTQIIGDGGDNENTAPATVLQTTINNFLRHSDELLEECFGPLTLLVEYSTLDEVEVALGHVAGTLTATVHAEPTEDIGRLVESLTARAGRVIFDGWPTGVAVGWGQNHGGPWPATTTQHTSVGATAIRRFLRPIAYQGAPQQMLPPELTDAGLARIPHRRNGKLELS